MIKKITKQLFVSIFFALTIFGFIPLSFLIANYTELDVDFSVLIKTLMMTALIWFLISGVVLLISFWISKKLNKFFLGLFFIAGLFGYFEYLFIMPHIGQLNGEPFIIKNHISLAVADIVFLLVLILVVVKYSKDEYFLSFLYRASLFLTILQGICLAFNPVWRGIENEEEGIYSFKYYNFDLSKYNVYSKNKNIAIVLLDGFGKGVFEELLIKYPEYKEIFKDFEFYPDTISLNRSTSFALPALFQGFEPESGVHDEAYYTALKQGISSDKAMLNVLKKAGYTNYIYPFASNLMYLHPSFIDNLILAKEINLPKWFYRKVVRNVVAFYTLPISFKAASHRFLTKITLDKNSKWLPLSPYYVENDFYNKFKDKIETDDEEKVFKFYHLRGLHEPYKLNANFEVTDMSNTQEDIVELTAKLYMTMLKNYLNDLKKSGIYDKTAVIIMSDHGTGRVLSPLQSEKETPVNTILLYKNFNQQQDEMKVVKEVYPDVEDISDLVFYSARITSNKFNIQDEQKNKEFLKNIRQSQKDFLVDHRLKRENFTGKIAYDVPVRIHTYVLNGKNGTLTINSPKASEEIKFCLQNKKVAYCMNHCRKTEEADGSYYLQFDFIGEDLPKGEYELKILNTDENKFYNLKTPIKNVLVRDKVIFVTN